MSATTSATTSGPTIATDKPDYLPGDTVTFTGSGWVAGDTVTITIHEDPHWTQEDRTVVAVVDGTGNFANHTFVVDQRDFGVTFTATAVANPSGLVAQMTFTDATSITLTPSSGASGTSVSVSTGGGAFDGNRPDIGIYWDGTVNTTNGTLVATCSTNGGGNINSVCTFPAPSGTAGSHAVVATQKTNTAKSVAASFTISSSAQTITVTTPAPATAAYHSTFNVAATASSGLAVSITSAGACTGSGSASVTITVSASTGTCTVNYDQAGNGSFSAAPQVTSSTTATKADQTIAFAALANKTYGEADFLVSATATSGLAVSFAAGATDKCTILSSPANTVHLTGAGGCTVTASQAGDGNYNAATAVPQTFTIGKATPVFTNLAAPAITFNATTTSAIVTGTLKAGALIATGPVGISIAGTGAALTGSGTLDATGNFSATVTGGSLPANATGYAIAVSYTATADFLAASDNSLKLVVNKANQTIAFTKPSNMTFGDADQSLTVSATSSLTALVAASPATVCSILAGKLHTLGAGTCTVTASQAGNSDYNAATDVSYNDIVIGKATPTITVTPYNVTYDGGAHTAIGTAKGVGGVDLAGLDLSGTTHTNAGTYATDAWTFTDGTGNYNTASGTANDVIGKATATIVVTPYSVTYDGNAHTATATAKGVGGADLTGLVLTGTTHTNAGTYATDGWSFTNANYSDASGTISDAIGKATATIVVTPYNVTYDGAAHTATATATGVGGASLTGFTLTGTTHANAGTYPADAWSFAEASGNYLDTHGTVDDAIGKATPTIVVTPYNVTYDGAAHTATGTAKGVLNEPLTGLVLTGTTHTNAGNYATDAWTFTDATGNYKYASGTANDIIGKATASITVTTYSVTYDAAAHTASGTAKGIGGIDLAGLDLSGTTHTNAGSYATDPWTFTDATGNYNSSSGTSNDKIDKATATILVTPYNLTYDGAAHTATATATGVGGASLTGFTLTGTAHTNAGTYATDPWSFTNPNYSDANGSVNDVIGKATATIVVTPYSVTYDGLGHTATATATGVGGVNLTGFTLTGTTHTNAGTFATDSWSFAEASGNYFDANGTVKDVIAKANATITVTPYSVTYDATAHTATGTAVGVQHEALDGLVLTGTTHTNAGNYATDAWTFTDVTGNYYNATGTTNDVIEKATPAIVVTPYSVTYDGAAHTATGTAKGIGGADLVGLSLTGTTHTNAGTYASDPWTFTDVTGNYKNANGTTSDAIAKATATISVTPYSVTYSGASHTATGTATGVLHEALTGLVLTGTSHTNAGTYATDPWSFTNENYIDANGTVNDAIAKANAVVAVTPYSVTYDGAEHTATGTAKGVLGEALSGLVLTGTKHTNAGTYATDPWTFTDATGNYNDASGTTSDAIAKANPTVSVAPYSVTYDGAAHTATGTTTGVLHEALTGLSLTGTTHTNAGNYSTDPWTFTDATGNYNNTNGTVIDAIAKATPTIAVTPYGVTYDALPHTATGTVTGVLNENLAGLVLTGTTHTNAGTYAADPWTFTDATGNYNNASGSTSDAIAKATATIVVTPYSVTFDGNSHMAAASAKGIGGVDLTGLVLAGTTHTNAGTYAADPWSFTNANYLDASGTVDDAIAKATPTVNVTPYHVTFDGMPHIATGTAKGVGMVNLAGLNLSNTTHTNAGSYGTDAWSFTDVTGNYNNANGTVSDLIDRATPTIDWNNPAAVDQGTLLSGTQLNATVRGVGGVDITSGGSLTYTPPSGTALVNVGSNMLSTSFTSGMGSLNYTNAGPKTVSVLVNNVAPTVGTVTAPTDPVAITTAVSISTSFTDPGGAADAPYTIVVNWGKDPLSTTEADLPTSSYSQGSPGSVNASHTYASPGVYTITVTVTDKNGGGNSSVATGYVVVYDPNAGFVTGGGWITSPAGACQTLSLCTTTSAGKATFGFVSKYKKGQSTPDGDTEFQFQAAGFNFKSTSYEWLVIAGGKAQYKGSGTINGSGDYFFMLTAVDGNLKGGSDTFRIKVWNKATLDVIYDNGLNAADSADPTTILGGGSVQIHDK